MTDATTAVRDSQFAPSVTYCVRRRTAKWAKVPDEARWVAISKDRRKENHYVGLAVSRTKTGAEQQMRSWAKLLDVTSHVLLSEEITLPWLWAGASSCVATVSISQQGALTAIQVYQHAYNAEYEWPEHLGGNGLRTLILDSLDEFDRDANYSKLPSHILSHLEKSIRSRASRLIAETADAAIAAVEPPIQHDATPLKSVWRLRTALRGTIAGLHDHQPESTAATAILKEAVSEIDTLLGVLNTQQLLNHTIADSRARDDQKRRDEEEAKRDKIHAEREARHGRMIALFATVFIGPSLVFAFFSVPSSPAWKTRSVALLALVAIGAVWLTIRLLSTNRIWSARKNP